MPRYCHKARHSRWIPWNPPAGIDMSPDRLKEYGGPGSDELVLIRLRCGTESQQPLRASTWWWGQSRCISGGQIVEYKIVR